MSPYIKYEILLMCNSITVCHVFNGLSVMVTDTVFLYRWLQNSERRIVKIFFLNKRLEIR